MNGSLKSNIIYITIFNIRDVKINTLQYYILAQILGSMDNAPKRAYRINKLPRIWQLAKYCKNLTTILQE